MDAVRVIGSGFGRTGTASVKLALERLGFGPCYHMEEVLKRPTHVREWAAYRPGSPPDLDLLFGRFGSAVDFPASLVYPELLERWPDARVVHTVRDPDRWYDSTAETIYPVRDVIRSAPLRWIPVLQRMYDMLDAVLWGELFDGRFEDRAHAIRVYERWTADVIATVPAEQLLVYEVADGWGPLCAFLDVPVPDEPFPRVNDKVAFRRRIRALQIASKVVPAGLLVATAAVTGRRLRSD